MLRRGFHIAFITPDPDKTWDAWYAWLVQKHGLSPKPAFIGMSNRGEARGKAPRRDRQKPEVHAKRETEARREQDRKRAVEHSPFAALEALRGRLTTRQPEGN